MNAARSVTATFRSNLTPTVVIYDDALASGWANWSWNATIDFAGTSPVKVGTHAAKVALDGWGALSPAMPTGSIDTYGYSALKFWVHGGTGSNKVLSVFTENENGESTPLDITAVANTWTEITVAFTDLGEPSLDQPPELFQPQLQCTSRDHVRRDPAGARLHSRAALRPSYSTRIPLRKGILQSVTLLDRRQRRRDVREVAIAVGATGTLVATFVWATEPWLRAWILILSATAALIVVLRSIALFRRRNRSTVGSLAMFCRTELSRLDTESRLQRTLAWWYLAPILVGTNLCVAVSCAGLRL